MDPRAPAALLASEYRSRMSGLDALKTADWLDRQRGRSVAERLAAGAELRAWAHRARPDLDGQRDREEDLLVHARVARMLRRADEHLAR